ncbi:hypothetical protein M0805_000326 [Coniferiporia weirii]|nr:hypothetical protein M0805_000326 [Coniferiporia weirii]
MPDFKLLLLALPLVVYTLLRRRRSSRTKKISPSAEHVLVLGASSGVGRALAVQYATRGARVCVVARGKDALLETWRECHDAAGENASTLAVVADFASAEDMVSLRDKLEAEWGRLDTLVVVAGVSSLRPVLETAGVERERGKPLQDADLNGVRESTRIAGAAVQGNFIGPYVAAVTFIPFLSRTSPSPSALLLSSLAAVAPAPTRALYGATKSASLLLYESLAIEHPDITFTVVLPATIEGDFRRSAVDGGVAREADPNKHGLRREVVAQRCIRAIDDEERTVFMAGFYRTVPALYYLLSPRLIERAASRKYRYHA